MLERIRATVSNLSYVLGVDVAKDNLSVCLMDRVSHMVFFEDRISNSEKDVVSFFSSLPADIRSSLCVAVEPTNTYWYLIAHEALRQGYQVVSAPPGSVKLFLRSKNSRVKNDRLDARGIALYASCMDPAAYQPKPEVARTLDQLLCLRRKVSETAAYYRQLAKSQVAGADVASRLLANAKEELRELDGRIKDILKDFEPATRLLKVTGFGTVVTAALISALTSNAFRSSDSFVAYIGYDLKVRESGKYKGRRMLTHNGDAELRRLLYLAAQSAIRVKGSPFAEIYKRHRESDRALSSTEAICVVARKMARTAWSMVRYQTEYSPDRVFTDARA